MASRWLYLVRHGQYEKVSPDEGTGGESKAELTVLVDGGLTALGMEQARLTAERLESCPIDAIHCSSLPRAVQTAEIIARAFPRIQLRKTQILWECIPCVPSSLSEHFSDVTPEEARQGGERAEEAYGRYFKPAQGEDKHEIVVCHGNLIRYLVSRALGAEPETWLRMGTLNCGISLVQVASGWTTVMSFNDSGHLPMDKRTAN